MENTILQCASLCDMTLKEIFSQAYGDPQTAKVKLDTYCLTGEYDTQVVAFCEARIDREYAVVVK